MSARVATAILRRLGGWLVGFVALTALTFGLARLAPGDPSLGPGSTRPINVEAVQQLRVEAGLEGPWLPSYARWLSNVVRLDLGRSLRDGEPVSSVIGRALPNTALLATLALALCLAITVPLGAIAALRPASWTGRLARVLLVGLSALPSYWVALALLLVFATARGVALFPLQGLSSETTPPSAFARLVDVGWHLVLPTIALALGSAGLLLDQARRAVADALRTEFARTARAKGVSDLGLLVRHALRPALVPLLTQLGMLWPALLGGSVIVEQIFALPGMGLLTYQAVLSRDVPMVMGTCAVAGAATLASLTLSDLLCAWADPRIERTEARS